MAITVIVELKANPGQRDELVGLIERMMTDGPPMPGSLGARVYDAVDDPDVLVEIADWQSAQARAAVKEAAEASGGFAPMFELLAVPPRATLVKPLTQHAPPSAFTDAPQRHVWSCVCCSAGIGYWRDRFSP